MTSFINSIKSTVAGGDDKKSDADQSSNPDNLSSIKPKAAGATADVVEAGKDYGKFDETKGVGHELKQADDYLRETEKSSATVTPPPVAEEKKEESGSGFGADAIKAAGNLFKKN